MVYGCTRSQRSGPGGRARTNGPDRRSSGAIPWLVVAAAVAAEAAVHCLRRRAGLALEVRRLAQLSRTDPLTGLHNRRHVEEHLATAVSAARRHDQPVSVLFVDIDGFKEINDHVGYGAGDEVLRAVGERVRLAVRAEDIVGRWGGEEFVAVLPATDLGGAVAVAERVRASIAGEPVTVAGRDARVTISVGCAAGPGDSAAMILEAAQAMRQAKAGGKNRVAAAGPPTES